jgi:predicted NACHT family NTPase
MTQTPADLIDPNGIAGQVAANLIVELFKETIKQGKKLKNIFQEQTEKYDILGKIAKKYLEALEQKYNFVKIFGMSKPIPLRNIYVNLNILDKITSRQRLTIDELEEIYDRDNRKFNATKNSLDAEKVIDKYSKLIVLGKPGAGKTTLLKRLVLSSLEGSLKRKKIPIFISLKEWSESNTSILKYIVNEFINYGLPDTDLFIHNLLDQGKALILLDGFDEITKDLDKSIAELKKFTDRYKTNGFVLSCRIAAYNYIFEEFTDVEISDFTPLQINTFIDNWFGKNTVKSKLCKESLSVNPPIAELATVPLLLTLLCIAFDENLDFPTNKAELYQDAVEALLKKWDVSRAIKREEIYRYLSVNRKEQMLGSIASNTFFSGNYFIKKRRLIELIKDYIKNLTEVNKDTLDIDGESVLKSIESQHGLLIERANGIYSFSHLTIQEFFTANYIINNEARGSVDNLLSQDLLSKNLREVLILTASLLPCADKLLLGIRKSVSEFVMPDYVNELFSAIAIKQNNYPDYLYRVVLLYDILNRLSVHSNQNSLTTRLLNDIKELIYHLGDKRCQIKTIKEKDQLKTNVKVDIDALYSSEIALKLNKLLIRERDILVDSMWKYMSGTTLLISCLRTQCYVSMDIRNKLIESILYEEK